MSPSGVAAGSGISSSPSSPSLIYYFGGLDQGVLLHHFYGPSIVGQLCESVFQERKEKKKELLTVSYIILIL